MVQIVWVSSFLPDRPLSSIEISMIHTDTNYTKTTGEFNPSINFFFEDLNLKE